MTQHHAYRGAPAEKTQLLPSAIKPASSVPAGAMPSVDDLPRNIAGECEEANIDYKPPSPPALLYGYFHSTCTFESAAALVSLHRSKAGAYRAMFRAQWLAWEEIQYGQRQQRIRGLGRDRGCKAYVHEASIVDAVEVLE